MVLYFSGTGNSRYAAKKIAEISNDEVLSINQRLKAQDFSAIRSGRPWVFVGPVYAGRLPRVMEDFIRRVDFKGERKAYFVCTCAATPWIAAAYVDKLCAEKKFSPMGFSSVRMPQGYIVGGGTLPMPENERILAVAEPKIFGIAELIRDRQLLPVEKQGMAIMSKVLNPIMYAGMIKAKAFYTTDKCTHCGTCAERCPLNNVTLRGGKPVWGKNCTHCMACIAGCPAEAIEYGKKTRNRPRYYLDDNA